MSKKNANFFSKKKLETGGFAGEMALKVALLKQEPIEVFSRLKNKNSFAEILAIFPVFAQDEHFNQALYGMPFPQKVEELGRRNFLKYESFEKELLWLSVEVKHFSKIINRFIQVEHEYVNAFLDGDFKRAAKILDEIQAEFGWSVWLAENRISLLQESKGHDEQKKYTESLRSKEVEPFFAFLLYGISLRAEQNISWERFQRQLQSIFSQQKLPSWVQQYFRFKLNFFGDLEPADLLGIIFYESAFSIIDRYLTFLRISQIVSLKEFDFETKEVSRKALKSVSKNITDVRLRNLMDMGQTSFCLACDEDSKLLNQALNEYTKGAYEISESICLQRIKLGNASPEFYEPYVKSVVRTEKKDKFSEIEGIKRNLIEYMYDVIVKNDRAQESFLKIMKMISSNQSHYWAPIIIAFVTREYQLERKSLYFKLAEMYGRHYTPRRVLVFSEEVHGAYFEAFKQYLGENAACLLYQKPGEIGLDREGSADSSCIALERLKLYEAIKSENEENYETAIKLYEPLLYSEDIVICQSAIVGILNCYLENEDFIACINVAAQAYILNENMYVALRLARVLDVIDKSQNQDVYDHIGLCVLYEAYSKHIGSDKNEIRSRVLRKFLKKQGVIRPSELLQNIEKHDKGMMLVFLTTFCVQAVMDGLTDFSSSDEVEEERIRICQIIKEKYPKMAPAYTLEIKNITQDLMIRKQIQHIEGSKIYIDSEGIKKSVGSQLKESFERYRNLTKETSAKKSSSRLVLKFKGADGAIIEIHVPANERDYVLEEMLTELRDNFVSSNAYGLDGHLSIGIRHGTLSGELRSPLEKWKLATQRDSVKNSYLDNPHWSKLYEHSDANDLKSVLSKLNDFTEKVDKLISLLNAEWIRIWDEKKHPNGLFKIDFGYEDQTIIQKALDRISAYDDFVDVVIAELWKKTELSLEIIRNEISEKLKSKMFDAFNQLEKEIRMIGYTGQWADLETHIKKARTDVSNVLDRVADWFRRSKPTEASDYDGALLVRIGAQIIKNIYPNKNFQINEVNTARCMFKGGTLKDFVNVVFILLDNVVKHGEIEKAKPKVELSDNEDTFVLKIKNDLKDGCDVIELRKKIDCLNSNFKQEGGGYEGVDREGGSGFYKLKKIFEVDLRCSRFEIKLSCDHRSFCVDMRVQTKGLICENITD